MPASVNTPSTSTHSRRTLRARSDTFTRLSRQLPCEGGHRKERVRDDVGRGDPTDESRELIGGNPGAGALGGQHIRTDRLARSDVPRGHHTLSEPRAHWGLSWSDGLVTGTHRHFDVTD